MNPNPSNLTAARKWLWPGLAAVVLTVWTIYSHITWSGRLGKIHGVVAFFLGVLALLLVNGLVRLTAGAWRNGWRWLFGRNAWRVCGWTTLFAISTVVLFYNVELWRGKRAWAAVVREAQARGESLEYKTLIPPPPPEAQNFARAPLFAPFFEARSGAAFSLSGSDLPAPLREIQRFAVRFHQHQAAFAPWFIGHETDFAELWRFHFPKQGRARQFGRDEMGSSLQHIPPPLLAETAGFTNDLEIAAALLVELEKFRLALDVLHPFSERPDAWFPLDERLTEHLFVSRQGATVNGLLRLLRLRASAELALGRPEAAFDDVKFILRLGDLGRRKPQPTSLAYAFHHLAVVDALQPLWEGLSRRCWTEGQVAEAQRQLGPLDFLSDYANAVHADALLLAMFVDTFIPVSKPIPVRSLFNDADRQRTLNFLRLVYPVGWSFQNQAAIHQFRFQTTSRYLDVNTRRVVGRRHGAKPGGLFTSSDPLFPFLMTPRAWQLYDDASESFPLAQTAVDLATLACALERHRLADGEFPTTLDALVPRFVAKLPQDIITGEPLKYRRTDDGGFVLYAVGFNGVDDGGKPSVRLTNWRGEPEPRFDLDGNDWVWFCPGRAWGRGIAP